VTRALALLVALALTACGDREWTIAGLGGPCGELWCPSDERCVTVIGYGKRCCEPAPEGDTVVDGIECDVVWLPEDGREEL